MQIIGGIASRIKVDVPKGFSVRPTLACSRKALFDSIGNFKGLAVADFFSGSGALVSSQRAGVQKRFISLITWPRTAVL